MVRAIPIIKGSDILFRTYNFAELMGAISKTELTEKQRITLKDLLGRIELTPNQLLERDRLIKKRDAPPQLGDDGKTLIKQIFDEKIRGLKYESFDSNQTEKGNLVEDSAINRIAKVNGWGAFLNANKLGIEVRDDIGIGHPDAIKTSIRIGFDSKASYSGKTFPLWLSELKESLYIWQAKRLAMMSNFDKWYIGYSLENTPEHIIIREAKKQWYSGILFHDHGHLFNNESDLTPVGEAQKAHINYIFEQHNFDHLADWERVKTFEVPLTNDDVKLIEKRAKLGRDYFDELMESYLESASKYHSPIK